MRTKFFSCLRRFSTQNKNAEEFDTLKKKLKCKFRSVGMLEIDAIMNTYLNNNWDKLDASKIKVLYNLMDIDTTNLWKLFYLYSNKDNRSIHILTPFLKNKEETEIKDIYQLLNDILSSNEQTMRVLNKTK